MSDHQTWASADASRVSTRSGECREQHVNLAFAELEMALDSLKAEHYALGNSVPYFRLSFSERAAVATSLIDGAAERLERLGAA